MTTQEQKVPASLIESMFEAGVHYGRSRSRRHPSFAPLVFGMKNKADIIDLEQTAGHLAKALEFVKETATSGKTILLVGTKPEAKATVKLTASLLNLPSVTYHWVGGTITNFAEMRKRIERYKLLADKKAHGGLDMYTKKERLKIDDEIKKLEQNFGGVVAMERTPDVILIIDPGYEHTAIGEAKRKKIPVVALAGSDCDISKIEYPVPGNDSSRKAIVFFLDQITKSYHEGMSARPRVSTEAAQ